MIIFSIKRRICCGSSLILFFITKEISETVKPRGISTDAYLAISSKCCIPPLIIPIPIEKVSDESIKRTVDQIPSVNTL